MVDEGTGYELYHGLADWWPLISPPEEYAEEAAFAGQVLRRATRPANAASSAYSSGGEMSGHQSASPWYSS